MCSASINTHSQTHILTYSHTHTPSLPATYLTPATHRRPAPPQASLASGVKDVSLSKLTASRVLKADAPVLGKRDCDLEVSHDLGSSESTVTRSTVLTLTLTPTPT